MCCCFTSLHPDFFHHETFFPKIGLLSGPSSVTTYEAEKLNTKSLINNTMKNNTAQYFLYRIWNTINGKSYIGQTVNPQHRFYKCHQRNKKMLADIERYGVVAFKSEILARTGDKKLAGVLEEHFINEYNSIENGYNQYKSYHNNTGMKRTEAANAKRREAISKTIWMYDPSTGQSTRANPARAKELAAMGWLNGRIKQDAVLKGSPKNKLFDIDLPKGTGDFFKSK